MRVRKSVIVGAALVFACIPAMAVVGAGPEAEVGQAVGSTPQAADDRGLIEELMNRYGTVHDFGTPEEYADLFTVNGAILIANGRTIVRGRDALIAQAKSDHERFSTSAGPDGKSTSIMRHLISNTQVTLTGPDSAVGQSYVTTVVQKGDIGPAILSVGRYEDEFSKQNGQWRIARRKIIMDFGNTDLAKKLGFVKG
jgi:hypothetical protein